MSDRPPHPRRRPMTLQPSRIALKVTARIAGFKPGTSPPPVRIPITPFFVFTFAIQFVLKIKKLEIRFSTNHLPIRLGSTFKPDPEDQSSGVVHLTKTLM